MKQSKLSRMKQNRLNKPAPLKQPDQDHLLQAEKYLMTGNIDQAKPILEGLIQTSPLDHRAFHHLATIAAHENRMEDSVNYILEAVTRNENDVNVHSDCGAILNRAGRFMEAEAACRHALSLRPRNSQAGNNLAIALQSQNRNIEAIEACQKVVKNDPEFMDALITMGNLQIRSEKYLTAVEYFAKVLENNPNLAIARANLAVALRELGEITEAVNQARTALRINPGYPQAHNVLGSLLVIQGHMDAAIEAFEESLKRLPGLLEARVNLAAALFKNKQYDKSITAYREVILLNDNFAPAHTGLGVVLLSTGKLSDAVDSFRRAIEIDPGCGEAHYNIASALGDKVSDDDIEKFDKALNLNNLSDNNRILVLFSKGEVFDKKHDYDNAFSAFDEANRLRQKKDAANDLVFAPDQFDAHIQQLKKSWNETKNQLFAGADTTTCPVFVVGAPRSGTTLVEQILSSHKKVDGRGEINSLTGLADLDASQLDRLDDKSVSHLGEAILKRFLPTDKTISHIIDKTPFNYLSIGLIKKIFPNAKIIVCRRHVQDIAISCFFQNFLSPHVWATDLYNLGRYLASANELMDFWQTQPDANIMYVDYEELVADPETESRKLIDYLGLDWDAACLNFQASDRVVLTSSNWQVRQPLYKTAVNRGQFYEKYLFNLDQGLNRENLN